MNNRIYPAQNPCRHNTTRLICHQYEKNYYYRPAYISVYGYYGRKKSFIRTENIYADQKIQMSLDNKRKN